MTRFLGIGECMMEFAPTPDGTYALGFAGDTFNTCWYLRRLAGTDPGLRVGYLSAVGDDDASVRMAAFMTDAGIEPHLARRPGMGVGLYLITLDGAERSFSYWRSAAAARTLADDLDALPACGAGDIVYLSGITLAILPPAARAHLLALIAAARQAGARVGFDPNYRPRLWPSPADAHDWTLRAAQGADIVLPSRDDEAALFGPGDSAAVAVRYLAAGAGCVVVKDGSRPVLAATPDTSVRHDPPPVSAPVDTTAAGDAFNAGFLHGLLRQASFDDACAQGSAVAGKVIAQHGALVPI